MKCNKKDGNYIYNGHWSKDEKSGLGVLEENDETYEGEFKNDLKNGEGKLMDKNGKIIHEGR